MSRNRSTAAAWAGAALAAALLAAPLSAGPAMESESQSIPRSAAAGGGTGAAFSPSHRLVPVLDEPVASSTASFSATHRLGAGLAHLLSFPDRVTDLAERGDVSVSSATLSWSAPGYDGVEGALRPGTTYFIRVASYTVPDTFSDHRLANVSFSTSGTQPGQRVSAGVTGLLPNTTYFARIWTMDAAGNLSYASALSTFTTLALPVAAMPESFLSVYFTSVTAHWAARPLSPPDAGSMTAAGYLVEASSTDFGALSPGGQVSSSATYNAALSTLTVSDPGLIVDRRYYFRVGALNWAGVPNWTALGSTVTKFQVNEPIPADPPFTALSTGGVVANWDRNGNPANAYYYAQVSTASDFTGVVTTTDTFNLFYSTGGLRANTTYHFQVQASTRSQSSGWAYLGSTMTWSPAPAAAAVPLPAVHASSLTLRWLPNGNPLAESTYTVVATTSPAYPNEDDGRVILASTKPAGADPAATLTGLLPNVTYYLFGAAHNGAGAQGAWTLLASTATRPAPPSFAGLETVDFSSLTVSWGVSGNPLGVTSYTVTLSTVAAWPPGGEWDVSLSTLPDSTPVVLSLTGLQLNATYHAFVRAVGHAHESRATSFSTATKAADPAPFPPTFTAVSETALAPRWIRGSADPGFNAPAPWTTFYALLSDNAGFAPAQRSSVTFNTDAAFSGLSPNTTYFARAAAYSHHRGTWTAYAELGSTSTLAALPAALPESFVDVHFTSVCVSWSANGNPLDVTTYTVVITSGYVYPNSLPDNVVYDTAPAGATLSSKAEGLSSNTTYTFFVRAVSHSGAATAWVNLGSTRTLNSPKTWVGGSGSSWHTAANWSPAGVPGFTDAVTIAQNASVVALAAVSFSSLTLGRPDGAAAAGLTLSSTTGLAGDVLIHKNSGLTQGTTHQLVFDGDFTMMSGSSLTHTAENGVTVSSVNIRVSGLFDLQAGATVTATGKGYRGGGQDAPGFGPGAGGTDTGNNEGGGGGGYGGAGGSGVGAPGGAGGGTYGSASSPIPMGPGGGGSGNTNAGGAGGGVVIIDAAQMMLDGVIVSSGLAGGSTTGGNPAAGGGGSGGGVSITAGTFSGTGAIDVRGGDGGSDSTGGNGGGGGGGRAAVNVTGGGTTCGLSVSLAGGAAGGAGATGGGDGSFFDGSLIAAPADLAGSPQSATSIAWTWSLTPGATDYQLFASTGGPMSPPLGAAASYTTADLAVNTTASVYVQARACAANLADSAAEPVSTLAMIPASDDPSFRAVATGALGVAWGANGNPAGVTTFTVVLSTDAAYPNAHEGTVTLSTFMAGPLGATASGLAPNTTYHLFVAAVNHAGLSTAFASLGATATLTSVPTALASSFLSVYTGSATVAWAALASGQGYKLEVSSTNFGVLSPGGLVVSSQTFAVAASTLAVGFPDVDASTNYYRVSGLNWNGAVGPPLDLGKLNMQLDPSVLLLDLGAVDMTVDVATVSVSSFVVYNRGDIAATYLVEADTNTAGSPWTLAESPGLEAAVLQGLWNSGPPAPPHSAFSTVITSHPRASNGAVYAGDQDAVLVPPGQSRTLWFRFRIPTSTVENGPQQLRVTVTPVKP
jgi:hypothetical protein